MAKVPTKSRTIRVQALARVEGEGGLTIRLRDGEVAGVELRIYEPPRFYEAFLRGRAATEVADITARICGICPVAYQMSAVHAVERIYGVTMPPALRALRRLIYCGEWIESHVLHMYMLHAPDFLGFDGAIAMAQASPEYAEVVRRGLRLKKAGNSIIHCVGGREVHPINVRVGGFYRVPRRDELASLVDELKWARDAALETVCWCAGLEFPDFEHDYDFVSLRHSDEYPMNDGRLVSSRGLDIAQDQYCDHFEEYQVPHSNALQSRRLASSGAPDRNGAYFVGPLARWNLNADRAPSVVREAARAIGIPFPSRNPFVSIVARSLEVLLAVDEALRIIVEYEPPAEPSVRFEPRAGVGQAITEAPRGTLYHRYETDAAGTIRAASIIPPTSQNQRQMEHDLERIAPQLVKLSNADAALRAEHVIRNYDPCISCATHFLRLEIRETENQTRSTGTASRAPIPPGTEAPIRVIGCGSPHGDDAAAWRAISELRQEPPHGVQLHEVGGGDAILGLLDGQGTTIVVDAVVSGAVPGTIHRLEWPDRSIATLRPLSTHQIHLADALRLAAARGLLPPRVIVLGIEAGCFKPTGVLSGAVAAALPKLLDHIRLEIERAQ